MLQLVGYVEAADPSYFPWSRSTDSWCAWYEGWNFNSGNYLFTADTK